MTRRGCLYFFEQADPVSGQVLDRAANKVSSGDFDKDRRIASIAATGFGLAALCVADKRKYFPAAQIKTRVQSTLQFHLNKMPHQHGFLFHFNDVRTGEPFGFSEVSSIDTAIFLCGVLTCRAYFSDDKDITDLATALYDRVEWPWMLNGGDTFAMGWRPASGFIRSRWNHYCELMMLYLLSIGSKTNPVSPNTWDAFTRPPMSYAEFDYISGADPLFVHQYSHAFSTSPTSGTHMQTTSRTLPSPLRRIKPSAFRLGVATATTTGASAHPTGSMDMSRGADRR